MNDFTKSDIRLQQEKYNDKQDVVLLTYIANTEDCEELCSYLKKALSNYLKAKKKKNKEIF